MAAIGAETRKFAWTKLPYEESPGPHRLLYHAGKLVGKRLYIVGTATEACLCLDIETMEWNRIPVENWRSSANEACLVNDCIFSIFHLRRERENTVVLFDIVLNSCIERSIIFPQGVLDGGYTADYIEYQHRFVVFGGIGNSVSSKALVIIDADTLEVNKPKASGTPPSARNGHASCTVNGASEATVFIYGGRNSGEYYHDLYLLHCRLNSFRWSRARDSRATGSSYSSLSHIAGKLFLYGGFDSHYNDINSFRIYELESESWHEVGSTGKYSVLGKMDATSAHTAVNSPKGLFFIGGFGKRLFPWTCILRAAS